jgi:DNA repair protein RadD
VKLRQYQIDACDRTEAHLKSVRGVCMVAPTGAGKTEMMKEMARRCSGVSLVLTHTKDLVEQTARRLDAGVIAAGHPYKKGLHRYVASIQTLVSRGLFPLCDQLLIDECHHFIAEEWRQVLEQYPFTPRVGFTATPERADGQPLGDIFDELVVAAHYSELTDSGFLVPVRLLRPASELDKGIALDPVEAYLTKAENRPGFIYCRSVALAYETADILRSHGVVAACIEANTDPVERKLLLERFAAGEIQVLTNMMALTEGVDVPAASVCVLARGMGHVSMYLQSCGRVMRPAPGKADCLVIDLPGLSHRYGPPNENRLYSLDGEAITRNAEAALRVCMVCGFTFVPGSTGACPRCGGANPVKAPKPQKIYNAELHELFNGPGTEEWVKKAELARLERVAKERGYNDAWVARQFKATFMEMPQAWAPTDDRKRAQFRKFEELAKKKGYKPGYAAVRYKSVYGTFPPRGWTSTEGSEHG